MLICTEERHHKHSKYEKLARDKKEKAYKRLFSKYSWCMGEGGILRMPVSYPEWKFDTTSIIGNYKGTNLVYGVLCEPISSDNE